MRGPLAACLIVLVVGCRRARPAPLAQGQVPERYRYLQGVMVIADDAPRIWAGLPYDRIELSEWGPWDFDGPSITLERGGAIMWNERKGMTGAVSIFDYGGLCFLIERIGFESMKPRYEWDGFDAATWTYKAWRSGSTEPIVVEDYGGVGPPDLWTLRKAIEGVAAGARWK